MSGQTDRSKRRKTKHLKTTSPPQQARTVSGAPDNGQPTIVTAEVSFRGPLPPPETLAAYDALHGGLADRIVCMAEREQNHRHEITQQAVEGQISESRRGQWVGGATAIAAVVGGCAIAVTASAPTGVIAGL